MTTESEPSAGSEPSADEKFEPVEDTINTGREFIIEDLSLATNEELLKMLEGLRTQRGERPKSAKRVVKKEKDAKMIAKFMEIVPPEMKPILEQLSDPEKLKVLKSIVEKRVKNKN